MSSDNDLSIEERLSSLESTLRHIQERNNRVEFDKAWETSWWRRSSVTVLTYLITAVVFRMLGVESFLRNAWIPTVGYLLSTLSLPLLKEQWLKRR